MMCRQGALMWDSAMAENGILKVGRWTDLQAQLRWSISWERYTIVIMIVDSAVIQPVYYRHIS